MGTLLRISSGMAAHAAAIAGRILAVIILWAAAADADRVASQHAQGELWRIQEGAKLIGENAVPKPAKDRCAAYHDCATCQGARCTWCAPSEGGNATAAHFQCAKKCGPGIANAGCSTVDFVMTLLFLAVLICGLPVACCCVFFMCPRPHLAATDYSYEAIEVVEGGSQPQAVSSTQI